MKVGQLKCIFPTAGPPREYGEGDDFPMNLKSLKCILPGVTSRASNDTSVAVDSTAPSFPLKKSYKKNHQYPHAHMYWQAEATNYRNSSSSEKGGLSNDEGKRPPTSLPNYILRDAMKPKDKNTIYSSVRTPLETKFCRHDRDQNRWTQRESLQQGPRETRNPKRGKEYSGLAFRDRSIISPDHCDAILDVQGDDPQSFLDLDISGFSLRQDNPAQPLACHQPPTKSKELFQEYLRLLAISEKYEHGKKNSKDHIVQPSLRRSSSCGNKSTGAPVDFVEFHRNEEISPLTTNNVGTFHNASQDDIGVGIASWRNDVHSTKSSQSRPRSTTQLLFDSPSTIHEKSSIATNSPRKHLELQRPVYGSDSSSRFTLAEADRCGPNPICSQNGPSRLVREHSSDRQSERLELADRGNCRTPVDMQNSIASSTPTFREKLRPVTPSPSSSTDGFHDTILVESVTRRRSRHSSLQPQSSMLEDRFIPAYSDSVIINPVSPQRYDGYQYRKENNLATPQQVPRSTQHRYTEVQRNTSAVKSLDHPPHSRAGPKPVRVDHEPMGYSELPASFAESPPSKSCFPLLNKEYIKRLPAALTAGRYKTLVDSPQLERNGRFLGEKLEI
eukprot:scaffold517_cov119-Cylindrotheca_fusiformis.AAC.6